MKFRPVPLLWLLAALPALAELQPMQPCPDSPNCVSSVSADEEHRVEPLVFEGDAQEAWVRLQALVKQMKRTKVITLTDDYLHVEVRTRLFRFVDDVEFLLDADQGLIQVRSASRTGHSDFGVNRKRVEILRRLFAPPKGVPTS